LTAVTLSAFSVGLPTYEGIRRGLHDHPGRVARRSDSMDQALPESVHRRRGSKIEVRQLYELADFQPGEAAERFREMGMDGDV
jgi:hypothetical protein